MLLNCGVGEDSWEFLGLQGDLTNPFWRRLALGFLWKDDAQAETPVLWPPHAKSWLTGKDSNAGRDWGQEEEWTTEDEMAGWQHQLDGREFEWTPIDGDGQEGLACCNSWGHKKLDTTERLNWTDQGIRHSYFLPLLWPFPSWISRTWVMGHGVSTLDVDSEKTVCWAMVPNMSNDL